MVDYSRIFPELFVGSHPTTTADIDRLRNEIGASAVLNVQTEDDFEYWETDWPRLEAYYAKTGVVVRRVPVRDFDPDDLQRNLPDCVRALQTLLQEGHTVFVHCTMGIGRSPSTVIAYLHWVRGWDLEHADAHVRQSRKCQPNLDAIRLATQDLGGPKGYARRTQKP